MRNHVWPRGTGKLGTFSKVRTVVVSNDHDHRERLEQAGRDDTLVVATPLDLIQALLNERHLISAVVLTGAFARSKELTAFLYENYPMLRVVEGKRDSLPDTYLPIYA